MKNGKKALLLAACAVLLVVATIFGTVAYLTSTDVVNNTFTVGNVQIKLDEALVGDDGQAITGEGAARVKENDYHLLPGQTYDKDPMVTVLKGSEKSYIRMLVTINKQAAINEELGDFELEQFFVGKPDVWVYETETTDADDDTITYEFRYYEVYPAVTADTELAPLFQHVTVPGNLTNDQLAVLEGLKIDIVAQAIQAASFADANAAWAAFPAA